MSRLWISRHRQLAARPSRLCDHQEQYATHDAVPVLHRRRDRPTSNHHVQRTDSDPVPELQRDAGGERRVSALQLVRRGFQWRQPPRRNEPRRGGVSASQVNGQGGYTVSIQVSDNATPPNSASPTCCPWIPRRRTKSHPACSTVRSIPILGTAFTPLRVVSHSCGSPPASRVRTLISPLVAKSIRLARISGRSLHGRTQ